jgi:hypothetical protein
METRLWWRLRWGSGGSRESGGRFCVGAFGTDPVSVAAKMFSNLTELIIKFYKRCTFNKICRDNASITFYSSTIKRFIPAKFDRPYCKTYFLKLIYD